MIVKHPYFLILPIFIFFLTLPTDIQAFVKSDSVEIKENTVLKTNSIDGENRSAHLLFQHGIHHNQQGNILGAIEDFSRALLLNPHDQKIQDQLISLASHNRLSGQQRLRLYLLEDIIIHLNNLKKKVDYFESKKNILEQGLTQRGYDKNFISKEILNIKKKFLRSSPDPQWDEETLYAKNKDPLEIINASFNFEKDYILNKIAYLEKQYAHLKNLYKDSRSEENLVVFQSPPHAVYAQRFHTLRLKSLRVKNSEDRFDIKVSFYSKETINEHPQALTLDLSQRNLLKNELLALRTQLHELRMHIDEKDAKVTQLTNQIIDLSLKLKEQEIYTANNTERLSAIQKQYTDLQSRFLLGQRIISEKDTKNQNLQERIKSMQLITDNWQKDFDRILTSKNEQLNDLNKILKIYKGKLADASKTIRRETTNITYLEEQVIYLQTKLFKKDKMLQKTSMD